MLFENKIWVGTGTGSDKPVMLLPQMANRHGLIGEYIGNIYLEVKGRPLYIISD